MEWISVKDKLPRKHQPVLVFVPENEYHYRQFIATVDEKKVWRDFEEFDPNILIDYSGLYNTITHWMPLPKPPKK